jgi:DNA adenine methylase
VKITPPLKCHGGKFYLAQQILGLMPPHLHYVEPYFGSGAVLFARDPADRRLWWPGLTSDGRKAEGVSEVVNDLDGHLINFYRVLKDPDLFEEFRRLVDLTQFSETEWNDSRELLAASAGGDVGRAVALFVLIRQSRQALRKDFATPVRTRLRDGGQDHTSAWKSAVRGLQDAHERLQRVMVLCRPGLQVIQQEDTERTAMYLDPPYYPGARTAPRAYGRYEMTVRDHEELLDTIKQCRSKILLSGYPNELYNRVLASWNGHPFDLPNNASGSRTKDRETEMVWCNY